jgi:hypothetical protein
VVKHSERHCDFDDLCNSRRKYKFTRIQQSTVGGHARIETTCRKSGTSWRTYTQIVKKKTVCKVQILTHIKFHESFNASIKTKIEVQDIHKASVYVGKIPSHTQV